MRNRSGQRRRGGVMRWGGLACAPLVVVVLMVTDQARVYAASAPTPMPVTDTARPSVTPAPQTGQLTLGQQHIAHGTTTLDAAVSGFQEGQHVTFTWAQDSGSPAAIGSALTASPCGCGQTVLHLPADAGVGTYTVKATGDRGDQATAFVTVDAPGATPAPTALSYSPQVIVPPRYTHAISGTVAGGNWNTITGGEGDQLPIRVLGYPPRTPLHVSLQLLAHGQHPAINGGAFGPTDAQGAAAGDVALPADLVAGPYLVTVAVSSTAGGAVSANATIQIDDTAANVASGWDTGVFAGLWQHATQGLLSWWQGVTTGGRAALVDAILGIILIVLDFTQSAYAFLFDLSKPLLIWGGGLLTVLITARLLAEAVTMRAEGEGAHHALRWCLLGGEVLAVFIVAGALKPIEHAVWAWTAGAPANMGSGAAGLKGYGDALGTWTTYQGPGLAKTVNWGIGEICALALLLVLAGQLILLTLGVLAGWVLKLFLWLTGPLCWAAMATPHTRPLGLWWLRSILSVSLWIVGWIWLFSIEGGAIGTIARTGHIDPSTAPNALVAIGVGLLMMTSTNMVPAVLRRGVALAIAGGGGIADEMAGPGGAVWGWAKSKIPVLGRL